MPKKFDTNPLDENAPEATAAAAAFSARDTSRSSYSTSEFPEPPGSITEEETRRLRDAEFATYNPAGVPATLHSHALETEPESDRKTAALPRRWLITLSYIPFYVGMVAGFILLLVLPKNEAKVRFHAAQGVAAQLGILIVTTILGMLENVTSFAGVGNAVFTIVTAVMLIAFALKAWKGRPVHIESVDDLTNWLEDKIGPIKS